MVRLWHAGAEIRFVIRGLKPGGSMEDGEWRMALFLEGGWERSAILKNCI